MEIKIRDTCSNCNGTGKCMTEIEAKDAAYRHNKDANRCNMGGNYLRAADFIRCSHCKGEGKKERWVSVTELLVMSNGNVTGAEPAGGASGGRRS